MSLHRRYEPATRCSTGPTPGAKALMAWFLGAYQARGGRNLGIFNCRQVRGSTRTTSLHGEGRACDFGINPHGAAYGNDLADRLRLNSAELGIQCVIWNRRIWSGSYPDSGFRVYSGTNPHVDHLHVELSKAASVSLTPQRVHQVLAGSTSTTPAPRKDAELLDNIDIDGEGTIRRGMPVGRASAVYSRAWVSLLADGPAGASAKVFAQSDGGGLADRELTSIFRDGWSSRAWWEVPDGTSQINVAFRAPDGGVLVIEALPK